MSIKLDYYDLLSVFIPGVLIAFWAAICFPLSIPQSLLTQLPEIALVLLLTVVAILAGQLNQALSSAIEPLLYITWCGKPSKRALSKGLGDRYLSESEATRLKESVPKALGFNDASDADDIFRAAQTLASRVAGSRTERFNALYGYHRALVSASIVAVAMLIVAKCVSQNVAEWSPHAFCITLALLASIALILWHRARQRAYYYVREVLLTAEGKKIL